MSAAKNLFAQKIIKMAVPIATTAVSANSAQFARTALENCAKIGAIKIMENS